MRGEVLQRNVTGHDVMVIIYNYLQKTQEADGPQPRWTSLDYQTFTSGLYHFKVLYEFQWTAGTLTVGTSSSIRKDLGQM